MNNKYLRDLLKKFNRTELSEKTGISYSVLCVYLYGKNKDKVKPSVEILWKIAEYTKVDFKELCCKIFEFDKEK